MTSKICHHISSIRESTVPLSFHDLGQMDYLTAWEKQLHTVRARLTNVQTDTVLFVEHESIYTAGKRTQSTDRPSLFTEIPVIEVDRGGKITWHGPGQLVAYPIIKLMQPLDVVRYVRRIELAIMATCREFSVETCQIPGRSGVWLANNSHDRAEAPHANKKIAAIGIRISQGITQHGLALNCNNSFEAYSHIIPCGLSDTGVTSLSAETSETITPSIVKPILAKNLESSFRGDPHLWEQFPQYTDK